MGIVWAEDGKERVQRLLDDNIETIGSGLTSD